MCLTILHYWGYGWISHAFLWSVFTSFRACRCPSSQSRSPSLAVALTKALSRATRQRGDPRQKKNVQWQVRVMEVVFARRPFKEPKILSLKYKYELQACKKINKCCSEEQLLYFYCSSHLLLATEAAFVSYIMATLRPLWAKGRLGDSGGRRESILSWVTGFSIVFRSPWLTAPDSNHQTNAEENHYWKMREKMTEGDKNTKLFVKGLVLRSEASVMMFHNIYTFFFVLFLSNLRMEIMC